MKKVVDLYQIKIEILKDFYNTFDGIRNRDDFYNHYYHDDEKPNLGNFLIDALDKYGTAVEANIREEIKE